MSKEEQIIEDFLKFADPIYWGENEYTSYQSIIPLYIKHLESEPEKPKDKVTAEEKPKSKRQSFKICAGCGSFAHGNPGHDLIP